MVAAPLLALWRAMDRPAIEWWSGAVDVVHGTNYVVPPSRRAARVVTVHDLTPLRFPELCSPTSRAYPALIRRAIDGGAVVHTPTEAVAAEVVELLGAPREQVRFVHYGFDRDGARPTRGHGRRDRPTCSDSAPSSPARTSRASCAPSTWWPPPTPT